METPKVEMPHWQEGADGRLIAEMTRFRLIVDRATMPRLSHFIVLVRRAGGGNMLIGSGTAESVGAAMTAAEEMARHSYMIANERRTPANFDERDQRQGA